MAVNIKVGDFFGTFKEVQELIVSYEKFACVNYYISDSRTIENCSKIAPKIAQKAKKSLVYYSILYTCIHGGRKFKSKSKGVRPNQSTFKQECHAKIRLGLTEDGQHLTVKEINEEHNHMMSRSTFDHLPRQRQFDESTKQEAALLLDLKANKKMVQEHLQAKTGKVVLLRDLSNIRAKNRSRPDNELETAVQILDETKGVVVVAATEDRNLVGLFYQDLGMQQTFSEFPELLLIDATYKLNDLRMPLYLLMVVDSNGESEIVGTFLAADDTHDTIAIMIQTFKTNNPAWINVKAIMSDKDFVERNVMREEFPQASLLICLFHVLRTFRREVTCERMGIRASQRDLCLDILQQIVYSKSQDEYDQKVELLMATGLESVCTYFRNSWDPIKEEFVECFKGRALTLGNRTNNRLESINEKIKSVCSKNNSLSGFYKEFLQVLHSLRVERDHRAMLVMQKRPVSLFPAESTEAKYLEVLTPFAFFMVKPHFELYHTVKVLTVLDNSSCEVESSAGAVVTSVDACPCLFRTSTGLPCKHILAVRAQKNLSLFEPNIVALRWTRHFYTGHQQALRVDQGEGLVGAAPTSIAIVAKPQVLTAHQKFRTASVVATELATLVSEASMRHFDVRLQQLRALCSAWKEDRETVVQVLDELDVGVTGNNLADNEGVNSASIGDESADDGAAEYAMAWEDQDLNMRRNVRGWDEALLVSELGVTGVGDVNSVVEDNVTAVINNVVIGELELSGDVVNGELELTGDVVGVGGEPKLIGDVSGEVEQLTGYMVDNEHDMITQSEYNHVLGENNFNVRANDRDDIGVNEGSVTVSHTLGNSTDNIASISCFGGESDYIDSGAEALSATASEDAVNINSGSAVVMDNSDSSEYFNNSANLPLKNINLPPKLCKRGRPKGAEKTVVGLPKKRARNSKLLPFTNLHVHEKERVILSWLFTDDIVNCTLKGKLIDEEQIEVQPELLSPALLDENVELKLIQRFFTKDGWLALNSTVKALRKHVTFFCIVCKMDVKKSLTICCDSCLLWCHLTCAGLSKPPKKKHWFCKECNVKA